MSERLQRVGRLVFKAPPVGQGLHIDPLDPDVPPRPTPSGRAARAALASEELDRYRDALRLHSGDDVRAAVLDDLSTYFGIDREECVARCIHWEASSVEEWFGDDRGTPDGLLDFYRTTQSWAFDLLWHAYLQAEGYEFPASVIAAQYLRHRRVAPGVHLDFGSGVGVTSQLFASEGYETHLSDVSTSLLDFARFRLVRRGQAATYLDLSAADLPAGRYDVITAIDTLAHVPDVTDVACRLHAALRPGGWLFANVDVRTPGRASAWHLQNDAVHVALELRRVGFRRRGVLDGLPVYQHGAAPGPAGRAGNRAVGLAVLEPGDPRRPAGALAHRREDPATAPRRVPRARRRERHRGSRTPGDPTLGAGGRSAPRPAATCGVAGAPRRACGPAPPRRRA